MKKDISHLKYTFSKRSKRLPIVLHPNEVASILNHLQGQYWLLTAKRLKDQADIALAQRVVFGYVLTADTKGVLKKVSSEQNKVIKLGSWDRSIRLRQFVLNEIERLSTQINDD